jgi:hypothetical protein
MKITAIRRILKEDLEKGEKVPAWVDALILPLNQFLEQVTIGLRNRLTFRDNFQSVIKTVSVSSGVQSEISSGSNLKVQGVLILDSDEKQVTGFGFKRLSNGNIGVTVTLSGGGTADVTFLILFE